jgi:hypothetical protein
MAQQLDLLIATVKKSMTNVINKSGYFPNN